jgi:enoyl-CoA hydratase
VTAFRIEHPAPGVALLTLDREPVNALDAATYREGASALRALGEDARVRAAILTGAGSRVFSGGADFAGFASVGETEDIAAAGREFFSALAQVPVPVMGALNGPAVGAGAMIAAQCDLLIAVPGAYLQVPELVNGFLGGVRHVKRLAPYHKVQRMMLLGERLSAEEALATGVILELVAAADLTSRACEIVAPIAELDPQTVAESLRITREPETGLALSGYHEELAALPAHIGRVIN